MKIGEALRIIGTGKIKPGYEVHFEWKNGSILSSDWFPERGEPLIASREDAFELARAFAQRTIGRCLHITVRDAEGQPVTEFPMIENRAPEDGEAGS